MTYQELIAERGLTEESIQAIVCSTPDQRSYAGNFRIAASAIQGLGVFTVQPMQCGEYLGPARLERRRTPIGRYLNHADPPNAIFWAHGEDLLVYLIADVARHREITIDYRQAVAVNREAPHAWTRSH
jgi:SET domain